VKVLAICGGNIFLFPFQSSMSRKRISPKSKKRQMEEHIPLQERSSWHQDDEITPLNPETNSYDRLSSTKKKSYIFIAIGAGIALFILIIIYWFATPATILCDSTHCIKQAKNILDSIDQSIDPWYECIPDNSAKISTNIRAVVG
jgi:hypothetical protein